MGTETKISWTDHTFNPWWGCTRVSPGCEHCYAETFSKRVGHSIWGVQAPRRFFGDKHWNEPVKWNAAAQKAGVRARVFCASMADVFEDRRDLDGQRDRLWALIHRTPWLDWQLLTKRPENVARLAPASILGDVWLGTTGEDQKRLNERLAHLVTLPARIRFVSAEPLLSGLTFRWAHWDNWNDASGERRPKVNHLDGLRMIHWVIAGAESGPGARPMDEAWVRKLRDECTEAGVAFFYKQRIDNGKKVELPMLDGRQWMEFPG